MEAELLISKPEISYRYQSMKLYTLILTGEIGLILDIDTARFYNTFQRESYNWMCVNIRDDVVSSGDECVGYVPPIPPDISVYHRYVFLIYEQPQIIRVDQDIFTRRLLMVIYSAILEVEISKTQWTSLDDMA
ncbi:Protein D2 [Thelohanellus kitauei]|uniref:Protein D2 n=1 Tax=Thelohanellus kitauei TaxID=669202 RepID=A0A0C2MLC5_THEKT|nr:Protein D2 [Thelohanellus kitauei]